MKIGVPKEIKNNENRVALTDAGALELTRRGHEVYIQSGAGLGAGITDDRYKKANATILPTIEDVYAQAEMIVKVKEPLESEYGLIKKDHVVFTYFHLAASASLTEAMLSTGAVCIAYETVQMPSGDLPLLLPMSEVAGRMATQEGAKYLEKPFGGKGKLLGGLPGVLPANVIVLGGGVVGTEAARIAAGMGANVVVLDINIDRMKELEDLLPLNVDTLYSNETNLKKLLPTADLVIGAVLIAGAKAPKLIRKDMLPLMQEGTVMVDVAVDQGGCFETTHPTTHADPTYEIDGIIHYCVANMPGAVPQTSTYGLTNATLPYVIQLANKGWKTACQENKALALGLNVIEGKLVIPAVGQAFDIPTSNVEEFLS